MRRSFVSFIQLAVLPAREVLRSPVLATVALTLVIPLMIAHQFGDTGPRLARDSGLAFQLSVGVLLAVYAASSVLNRERRSGSAVLILIKPVAPAVFFLSRFAGIVVAVGLFSCCTGLSTLLAYRVAERFTPGIGYSTDTTTSVLGLLALLVACVIGALANAFSGKSFHAASWIALPFCLALVAFLSGFYPRDGAWSLVYVPDLEFSLLILTLTVFGALLVFTATALTLTLVFPPVTTVAGCLGMLAVGLISEWLVLAKASASGIRWLGWILLPNWHHFWIAEPFTRGQMPLPALFMTALYAMLYTAAVLMLGIFIFENSEYTS